MENRKTGVAIKLGRRIGCDLEVERSVAGLGLNQACNVSCSNINSTGAGCAAGNRVSSPEKLLDIRYGACIKVG